MEDLTFKITKEKLAEGINEAVDDIFKSTYSNPLRKSIEEVLTENKAIFKEAFSKIVSELMSADTFKEKLGEIAMAGIVESMLKK